MEAHFKHIVYIDLVGRIGNNLFQIAAGASLAKRMNARFITIPNSSYQLAQSDGDSLYDYLQQFKNSLLYGIDIREGTPLECIHYYEPCFHYKKLPHLNNVFLHGYFQSEKYFYERGIQSRS